jgi:hypothetical protein
MAGTIVTDRIESDATYASKIELASPVEVSNTFTATGGVDTNALSVAGNNISNAGGMMFRNRIINGDMRIDQRNAGTSVTPTNLQYGVDRWQAYLTQSSKFSMQQSSTAPAGFKNSLLVTSLSAYSVVSGDFFNVLQFIEGFNVADLDWGTASAKDATVSFWVRSSLTGTFGGHFASHNVNRTLIFSYTINAADTWEYKTITIPGDTAGTWLKDNGVGLFLAFSVGAGASLTTSTTGVWGDFFRSVTGQTSLVGTSGATWQITGVQLEAGTVATPFEHRSFGQELALCQRYYENTYPTGSAVGSVTVGPINFRGMPSGSIDYSCFSYAVVKRAVPTLTAYNGVTGASGTWRGSGGANRTITLNPTASLWGFFASGWALGDFIQEGHFTANSEL